MELKAAGFPRSACKSVDKSFGPYAAIEVCLEGGTESEAMECCAEVTDYSADGPVSEVTLILVRGLAWRAIIIKPGAMPQDH